MHVARTKTYSHLLLLGALGEVAVEEVEEWLQLPIKRLEGLRIQSTTYKSHFGTHFLGDGVCYGAHEPVQFVLYGAM